MTEASDSKCRDRRKRNVILPSSIEQQHIELIFRPLRKIPLLSQRGILIVLPYNIFLHFSYHEKSFSGYSKKNLQLQEEPSDGVRHMQTADLQTADLQTCRLADCRLQTSRLQTCRLQTCSLQTCRLADCRIEDL